MSVLTAIRRKAGEKDFQTSLGESYLNTSQPDAFRSLVSLCSSGSRGLQLPGAVQQLTRPQYLVVAGALQICAALLVESSICPSPSTSALASAAKIFGRSELTYYQ